MVIWTWDDSPWLDLLLSWMRWYPALLLLLLGLNVIYQILHVLNLDSSSPG